MDSAHSASCQKGKHRRMAPCASFLLLLSLLLASIVWVEGVDRNKFRKCGDTGFCKRHRHKEKAMFNVVPSSIVENKSEASVTANLVGGPLGTPTLSLSIGLLENGATRITIKEKNPMRERWITPDVLLEENVKPTQNFEMVKKDTSMELLYGANNRFRVSIGFSPFTADLFVDGTHVMGANKGNMLHFEHYRSREGVAYSESNPKTVLEVTDEERHRGKEVVGYWEDGLAIYADGSREQRLSDAAANESGGNGESPEEENEMIGMWEESYEGHKDSKPLGPSSVGLDIFFPRSKHVYGIPEHASSFALKTTTGPNSHYKDPYRLYNLDVCEYELDETMALYGSIPFMMSHSKERTNGVWWFNPTELFVDIEEQTETEIGAVPGMKTHWMSESGVIDLFMFPGPNSADIWRAYGEMTGFTALPPLFSLGYHQCRWNYKDEKDVLTVNSKFEELDMPYDVLWLDIEHTDGKRYFTWDSRVFPNPVQMQNSLHATGRRMVTIVDPHIKRDNNYHVHSEATAKGLYVRNKEENADYEGWCWPGSSSYLDFTSPRVREWWSDQFSLERYKGSTFHLYTWNDMNEPSVFNGPEVSMPKDVKNLEGIEHRQWHNIWGMFMHKATSDGLVRRHPDENERPFVLSRAFFSGSQRYGAIWTGDNEASWEHLKVSAPMLLSINLAGLGFAGADVGGFFKNTEAELMVRWMQAGAFQPFFRGHAHHDTDRKEPWVYGEPYTEHIRKAIALRYTFLPYWYSVFHEASVSGMPIMRPLWAHYPSEEVTFGMEDQWLIGRDLLVKPITDKAKIQASVYFPLGKWYDILSYYSIQGAPGYATVKAPLDKIPVFQRGGSIIPRKMRLRRSSQMMTHDPYTLVVALDDSERNAEGMVYLDDEHSFDYRTGDYELRKLSFKENILRNEEYGSGNKKKNFSVANEVERIVILGYSKLIQNIEVSSKKGIKMVDFSVDTQGGTKAVTIRKPELGIGQDWQITIRN